MEINRMWPMHVLFPAEARDIRFIFETALFELRSNENADTNLLRRYNKSAINLIGLPPAISLAAKISQWNGIIIVRGFRCRPI